MDKIRYPKITDVTTEGQVRQMKEYLHQLTNQLNFALKATDEKLASYTSTTGGISTNGGALESPQTEKKESAEETFFKLKNLIIKSADIVNAYSDIIEEKLNGIYTAKSEFGEYKEMVDSLKISTAESETTFRESIKTIENELGNLSEIRNTFYIKTGFLDDGNTIGGIELGESKESEDGTDKAFARFTTGALTFFNGEGTEEKHILATFSAKEGLVINYAKINNGLEIGQYLFDTSNGIAFKWIGEN